MAQTLVFTALPATDNKTNKPVISVFVSIQLQTGFDTTLATFPDIRDWIKKIGDAEFKIRLNDTKDLKGTLIKSKLDKSNYESLFASSIKVKNYQQEDLSKYPIKSYPVKHIIGFIEKAYKEVGNAKSDELPNEVFFTDQWKGLNDISDYAIKDVPTKQGRERYTEADLIVPKNIIKRVQGVLAQSKVIPFSNTPQPSMDFGQLKNFHTSGKPLTGKPPVLANPDFEYHDILSVLSGYPLLQRKFGLVLDLELTDAAIAELGTGGKIRVVPQNLNFSQATSISCPSTAFVKTSDGFYTQPKPGGSIIDKGLLKINTPDFSIVQYDTDGAALKLCNQIDNLTQQKAKHISMLSQAKKDISFANQQQYENDSQRSEGLPVLRSAGIGVVRNGLAADLFQKLVRSNTLNNALLKLASPVPAYTGTNASFLLPGEILYADDLVQGYRMDIHNGKEWLSLHRRLDIYQYNKGTTKTVIGTLEEDEGFIQLGASQEQQGDKAMAIGEVIARWEGWSLSVRRPGLAINNPGQPDQPNDVNNYKTADGKTAEDAKYLLPGDMQFRLQVDSKIVKGSLPKLRFGNEYSIKIRTVDLAGNSVNYKKEPENKAITVAPKIKYRRYEPTPSPVLLQANKIKDGESLERMVIRSNKEVTAEKYESTANDKDVFLPVAIRHVLAPRNTQHIAEVHDMFDGMTVDKTTLQNNDYTYINSKDAIEFTNPADGEEYKKISRTVTPDSKNVPLTYLADPMAAGVVFFLDGQSDFSFGWPKTQPKFCSFYDDAEMTEATMDKSYDKKAWQQPKSFRVEIQEGTKRPEWIQGERKLIVYLPKATIATVNYASFWRPEDVINKSGIHSMVVETGTMDTKRNARQSKHWMISPWRQLTLVHAIQQPLAKPEVKELKVARNYNDTTAKLNTRIAVHGKSTDKINLEALWLDFLDDFADIAPKITMGSSNVTSLVTDYFNQSLANGSVFPGPAGSNEKMGNAIVHQWNDTKHRWVFYRPVATTRYREYFTNLANIHATNNTPFPLIEEGEYFKDATTDKFNPLNNGKVNVLSTARPAAPLVEYVLPSFNWAKNVKGKTELHVRTGNIRVYLKRPWFSSGEGERLGVILRGGDFNNDMAKYVTLWGKDPVFTAGDLNGKNLPTPDQATFPFAADYDVKVSIAEEPSLSMAVAAYNVLYDADRQLYYADIPINSMNAYFPFVKLALCRYQRDSLRTGNTDCCISSIVQTDWIQLVPPRTVGVVTGAENNKFMVGVSGTSSFLGISLPTVAHNRFLTSRIRIVVEDAIIPKSDQAYVRTQNRNINTVVWEKDFDIVNTQIINGQLKFETQVEIKDEFKTKPYRVIVEEYELHLADPLRIPPTETGVFAPSPASKLKERLVFMDVFEVNGSV
jgi:hypothetical protein